MDSLRSKENLNQFESIFGKTNQPPRLFQAPARINIIGEHVDYLGGTVLPAAIDFFVQVLLRPNESQNYRLHSVSYNETVELKKPLSPIQNLHGLTTLLVSFLKLKKKAMLFLDST